MEKIMKSLRRILAELGRNEALTMGYTYGK